MSKFTGMSESEHERASKLLFIACKILFQLLKLCTGKNQYKCNTSFIEKIRRLIATGGTISKIQCDMDNFYCKEGHRGYWPSPYYRHKFNEEIINEYIDKLCSEIDLKK